MRELSDEVLSHLHPDDATEFNWGTMGNGEWEMSIRTNPHLTNGCLCRQLATLFEIHEPYGAEIIDVSELVTVH